MTSLLWEVRRPGRLQAEFNQTTDRFRTRRNVHLSPTPFIDHAEEVRRNPHLEHLIGNGFHGGNVATVLTVGNRYCNYSSGKTGCSRTPLSLTSSKGFTPMPEATNMSSTQPTRRAALRFGGLATFAGVVGLPTMAQSTRPDADLLRLGQALGELIPLESAAWAVADAAPEGADMSTAIALNERVSTLVDQIEVLPATTLSGVLVKVRALLWCRGEDPVEIDDLCDIPGDHPPWDMRLIVAVLRDLTAMQPEIRKAA